MANSSLGPANNAHKRISRRSFKLPWSVLPATISVAAERMASTIAFTCVESCPAACGSCRLRAADGECHACVQTDLRWRAARAQVCSNLLLSGGRYRTARQVNQKATAARSVALEAVADTDLDPTGQWFIHIRHDAGVTEPHNGPLAQAR